MNGLKVAVIINGVSSYGGKEIAKGLTKFFRGHIYLTGTDLEVVDKVRFEFKREFLDKNVKFLYLDTNSNDSIDNFHTLIQDYYGGIDVYINYEGITNYNDKIEQMTHYELAVHCLEQNYFQIKKTDSWMFPLLKPNAQVIHLISNFDDIRTVIDDPLHISSIHSTDTDLDDLVNTYLRNLSLENTKRVDLTTKMEIETFSRMVLAQLTKMQQRIFNEKDLNIAVNVLITDHVTGTYLDKNYRHVLTRQQTAAAPVKMVLRKSNSEFRRKGKVISGLRDIILY